MAHCAIGDDYDTLRQRVIDAVDAARALGVAESWLRYFEEDVRGVDAPQIQLTAGKVGVWSGTADEDGIVLEDLKDTNNLPRTITHDQTNGAAYAAAAKCWSKVKLAESMHEAAEILRGAGARLHYFCAMD